ncbi:ArsR family transcriptional regulator [Paenibacillus thalictri]|uniref:ArsR family transcriptional regulator n=1 Tax=Paenibacillus thalictri TaxID=2527873 RepID=A0A4Q9DLC7_9BACL|nr:ArsR family transcriptional regulator [Paenibacillus thalictri]TBL72707.1 ArsR family transcriptional regulator [Paenibacillus thalictri]
MTVTIGYVGVEDTMELVLRTAAAFPEVRCIPLIHTDFAQIPELLDEHAKEVDMWLFSGPLPYEEAKRRGQAAAPMFYIPYGGTSLYRTLCQIFLRDQTDVGQLSFDMFSHSELSRLFAELGMTNRSIHTMPYNGSYDDLIEHHRSLWKTGVTKAAVTCVWIVQQKLERLGIPVFRVVPTESVIESALNAALRAHETLRMQDAQIAVQMIETDLYAGLTKEMYSSDELFDIEIAATRKWLSYAKLVHGSLKAVGPGRYVIFTTRGILRDWTHNFTAIPDIEALHAPGDASMTCGIGIGLNAYEAEMLAGKALLHTREYGKGSWIVFFEDKTISGPLGKPEQLSFSYASVKLQRMSERSLLSVSTLGKLESILTKRQSDEINAYELAQFMQIQPRSARRILIQLEASGYAEVIGEEMPHPRGRPRKKYRIVFEQEC